MHTQENLQQNPEPFLIIKNARNKNTHKTTKNRKNSEHHPTVNKKKRKMTAPFDTDKEVQCYQQIVEEKIQNQSQQYFFENEQFSQKEHLFSLHQNEEKCSVENEVEELEKGIPFNCDERELDRETPYLRSFEVMQQEFEEMNELEN